MAANPIKILPLLLVTVLAVGITVTSLLKDVLASQLSQQWRPTAETLNVSGEYDSSEEIGEFLGRTVQSQNLTENPSEIAMVLGDTDAINKHIEVDLSTQKVYALEGDTKVMEFLVSTGKWGKTPTGHFRIAYKTLAQKMSGGSKALGTYYYLPNVQFVQFFGNDEIPWSKGFSFHEAYWHNNFGTPMSHGCINMRKEDAEKLFYWTTPIMNNERTVKASSENEGTPVFIYGETPAS
jgi:lipoprotein-anchoring transpeptidase ErfK/SrfK